MVAQTVKHLPAMQRTWVQSLGQNNSLEKGKATHSSILDPENSRDRGAWQATVHGVTEWGTTKQLTHTHTHTHRAWGEMNGF